MSRQADLFESAPPAGAEILPFPLQRRRALILRCALRMSELSAKGAENHLAAQIRKQRETLQRRGIATAVIDREVSALESAVRSALARLEVSA